MTGPVVKLTRVPAASNPQQPHPVYVNMANVTWFERRSDITFIAVAGEKYTELYVAETPEEIQLSLEGRW